MNGGGFSDIFLYSRTRRLFAARVAIAGGDRLYDTGASSRK